MSPSAEAWRWDSETTQEETWNGYAGAQAKLEVLTEVPLTKALEPLPRRGNRYYPTMVGIGLHDTHTVWMPDECRDFAAALIRYADAAEAVDAPDTDTCGHWFPCGCDR